MRGALAFFARLLTVFVPIAGLLVVTMTSLAEAAMQPRPIDLRPGFAPLVEIRAASLWGSDDQAARSAASGARLPVTAVFDRPESAAGLAVIGVQPLAVVGRVASLSVSAEELHKLSSLAGLIEVDVRPLLRPQLDMNAAENGAATAHASGKTGAGVLIAVIDSGIDIRHLDFRQPDGRTRIKYLWDQFDDSYRTSSGQVGSLPPLKDGQPLGTVYTEQQINSALRGEGTVASLDLIGHGTAVAGAAAGNGQATGNGQPAGVYVGVAPAASLLVVRIGGGDKTSRSFSGDTVQALQWVGERAQDLGMPVVVNMSFGSHVGAHDGSDPLAIAVEGFVGPGRAVVASAGNEGSDAIHASGSYLDTRVLRVRHEMPDSEDQDYLYVDCWVAAADEIDVGVKKPNGDGDVDWNVDPGKCLKLEEGRDRQVLCVSEPSNGRRRATFYVAPRSDRVDVSTGVWQLYLRDDDRIVNGHYDCWASGGEFLDDVDPSTTITSLSAGSAVVAVGASTARNRWPSAIGEASDETTIGDLAFFSSRGPTLDGRLKPDLVTGGNRVVLPWSTADGSGSGIVGVPPNPSLLSSDGAHFAGRGTSFSSPQVAGAVALLFEINPTLTAQEVRQILVETARRDDFTGSTPNDSWGAGKLDIAAAVASLAPRSCTGDCDASDDVTVEEILTMVGIALGAGDRSACVLGDEDGDGQITVNEILAALDSALTGCLAGD